MTRARLLCSFTIALAGCAAQKTPGSVTAPPPSAQPGATALPPSGARALVRADGRAPAQVALNGGEVLVGDPDRPQQKVLVLPFRLDVTEVTADQYAGCIRERACSDAITIMPAEGYEGPQSVALRRATCTLGKPELLAHPVNCVTWVQARDFCAWAGNRLPSVAEWIFAAVGSAGRTYPWGEEPPDGTRANFGGTELKAHQKQLGLVVFPTVQTTDAFLFTAPVASFPRGASPEGVFDLAGNVLEWLDDPACVDPPCEVPERAARGTSWRQGVIWETQREFSAPETAYGGEGLGFRCAASIPATPAAQAPLK
jgi:formylglycine-generating enzyme required for sulfatase activity